MIWAVGWLVLAGLFIFFGFVIVSGAPYVPTLDKPAKDALDLLDLKRGQVFYDLGCGDGRLLAAAASRGWRAVGYELNPILVLVARFRCRRFKKLVTVHFGSLYKAKLDEADGVFIFMAGLYMKRLDRFFKAQNHSFKLVSNAFEIPGKRPVAKRGAVFLYRY